MKKLEYRARNIDIFNAMVSFRSVKCIWTVHMLLWVDFLIFCLLRTVVLGMGTCASLFNTGRNVLVHIMEGSG